MFKIRVNTEVNTEIIEICQKVLAAFQKEFHQFRNMELTFSLETKGGISKKTIIIESEPLPSSTLGVFEHSVISAQIIIEGTLNYLKGEEAFFTFWLSYTNRDEGSRSIRLANKGQTSFSVAYHQKTGEIRILSTNKLVKNALQTIEIPLSFGESSKENMPLLTQIREYFKKPTLSRADYKELTPLLSDVISKVNDYSKKEELDSYDKEDIEKALLHLEFTKKEFEELLLLNK